MKKLSAILVLGLALTRAAAADAPATFVKLVGLSTVPEARCAFLLVLEANRPTLGEVVLAEGKSNGALELVAIDDQTMTAKIRNGGKESVLSFSKFAVTDEAPILPATRAISSNAGKKDCFFTFQNVPVTQVLDFYAQLTGRTILRPTMLPVGLINAQGHNLDRGEAVRMLEQTFTNSHLQVVPQGEKFIVVLSANLPLPAAALWKARKTAGAEKQRQVSTSVKMGAINFIHVPSSQALSFYGKLAERKVEQAPNLPSIPITLKTATSLSLAEVLYAFETVLLLNGIQIVAVDDQTVKAMPLTPPVNKPAPSAKPKTSPSK